MRFHRMGGVCRNGEDAVLWLVEAPGRCNIAVALPGVDGPDILDAHSGVVVDALLKLAE
jgi:hypothetical protein